MRYLTPGFATALFLLSTAVASAQISPGGPLEGGAGGAPGGGAPQPRGQTPDIAPPALPGAGSTPLATGPVVQRQGTGDPTVQLFAAINKGDYNSAQDAISRGADTNALDPLGETPLDLAVALNRTTITFLILSARNEAGDAAPMGAPMTLPASSRPARQQPLATAARPALAPAPVLGNDPGTPNAAAGFLGFGAKS